MTGVQTCALPIWKRPIDNIFQDRVNLHDFVKASLPERITDIVDPILLWEREVGETRVNDITHNEDQNGSLKIQECLILILGIGVACFVEFSRGRMNDTWNGVKMEVSKFRNAWFWYLELELLVPRNFQEKGWTSVLL